MPSTYAHYRLGQEVRNAINGNEKTVVETYPDLFNIGLHGPDILFYYHPLKSNSINSIGFGLHGRAGREFFENAASVIGKVNNAPAHLAYLYGVICHFALDVTCHGYIDEKIKSSGISHGEIEVEFDRALMVKDGYNPIKHKLTNHIAVNDQNSCVIKDFYKGVSSEDITKALEGMICSNNLLLAPSKLKRTMIYALLKLTGNYKEMHGLMVNFEKNEKCNDSTGHLMDLYDEARRLAIRLIIEYKCYLSGLEQLDSIYDYTFGSKLIKSGSKEGFSDEVQINKTGKGLGII
ncbi:MAG: zinc dependent phospholipase C family protein [Eubacteriales bacterium]|nr:zinc dependent phospholipase C family protein [Eubacteriales bacterium]